MKHLSKVLALGGLAGVVALITARGMMVTPSTAGRVSKPGERTTVEARDHAGNLVRTYRLDASEDPMKVVESLQKDLPASFPDGGTIKVVNGEKWLGILGQGMAWKWGQDSKPGG